jgi:hypothetical protein
MTEKVPQLGFVDPSLTTGSQVSSQELSAQRIGDLGATARELSITTPEFVGMTLLGSVARGEATPESDVDIFVFIKPDQGAPLQDNPRIPVSERIRRVEEQPREGTVEFHGGIGVDYQSLISDKLGQNNIDKADIFVLPIDESIVDSTTQELLQNAKEIDEGNTSIGAHVPHNIRGLFHVPIDDVNLQPYIHQVLSSLQNDSHGQTAWRMIRQQLAGFERHKTQKDFDGVQHRNIPLSLSAASEQYGLTFREAA